MLTCSSQSQVDVDSGIETMEVEEVDVRPDKRKRVKHDMIVRVIGVFALNMVRFCIHSEFPLVCGWVKKRKDMCDSET